MLPAAALVNQQGHPTSTGTAADTWAEGAQ